MKADPPSLIRRLGLWMPSWKKSLDDSSTSSMEQMGSEPSFFPKADWVLWVVVISLLGLGIVMTYSASAIPSYRGYGQTTYFLSKELVWAGLGIFALLFGARLDHHWLKSWAYPLLCVTIVLLIAVLFSAKINGAHRWFRYGALSLQPAELAKLSLVIYLAQSLSRREKHLHSFTEGFIPPILICSLLVLLLLLEPDLGTSIILWLVTLTLLFLAGTKVVFILTVILTAAPIVYMKFLINTHWRLERIQAYLNPWLYRNTVGYQIISSLVCIASGGMFGVGLGQGRLKLYLPEAHTDYIFAVIGEELGLMGIALVIVGFAIFVVRGIRVASLAKDSFGYYLACGITSMIGFQAAINMGVALGVLPTKGLTLPFVSFGGSSLLTNLFSVGILLNISRGETDSSASSPLQKIRHFLFPPAKNKHLPLGGKKVKIDS